MLSQGTIMEQKAFLRSFIRTIAFDHGEVAIEYTIPVPAGKDTMAEKEVLSIEGVGSPSRTRTYNLAVNSRPLYH